jgi:hypothetical protein
MALAPPAGAAAVQALVVQNLMQVVVFITDTPVLVVLSLRPTRAPQPIAQTANQMTMTTSLPTVFPSIAHIKLEYEATVFLSVVVKSAAKSLGF